MIRRIALLSLLALSACGSPPYPAYSIGNDAERVSQVVMSDAILQEILRAGVPLVERLQPEDYLRVVVPIRNVDDEPVQVLAQMSFLDRERRPLLDDTNRQVMILPAGGTSNFEAISRGPQAEDFVLRLSWNK